MKQILTLITCLLFTGLAYGQKQEPLIDSMQYKIAQNNIDIINIKSAMNKHHKKFNIGIGTGICGAFLGAFGTYMYSTHIETNQITNTFRSGNQIVIQTRPEIKVNKFKRDFGISSMVLGYALSTTGLIITIDSHKHFKIK